MRRAALLATLLAACSKDERAPAPEPAPPASDGGARYQPSGDKPANARRPRPPEIESGALAVGATAPDFDLPATGGLRFRLADALSREERVVVVFYRGDW